METLSGCKIKKVIFKSSENDYSVLSVEHEGDEITVVYNGNCNDGDYLDFYGDWKKHKKYGLQFNAVSADIPQDLTIEQIQTYLRNVKHIGPKRAKKITDAFGLDALRVAVSSPEKLRSIGIPQKAVDQLYIELTTSKELSAVKMRLLPLGITANTINRLYEQYGAKTVDTVYENPYILADEVSGIGFIRADSIARRLNIDFHSKERIQAGIIYTMHMKMENEGHTYCPLPLLVHDAAEVLTGNGSEGMITGEEVEDGIKTLLMQNKLTAENREAGRIYIPYAKRQEDYVASKIRNMVREDNRFSHINIAEIESLTGIRYTDKQKEAIIKAAQNYITVITGGPGTGKTTILKAILKVFSDSGLTTALAAPTGKAAKRLEETTGQAAKTIHRLLEAKPSSRGSYFQRDEDNPIEEDAVIIDETSMIDLYLMYSLIKAVSPRTKLVLVGDADQLPSVGPGNVLRDLLASGVVPETRLNAVFRQAKTSSIIWNAHLVNNGIIPELNGNDFILENTEDPEEIVKAYAYYMSIGKETQILTPMKKGDLGTENLNALVREAVNPPSKNKREVYMFGKLYRAGDKIMQTSNNYTLEIFNGDTGTITKMWYEDDEFRCQALFGNRLITLERDNMADIVPAYAITIHKSQGSEFDVVLMPVSTKHYIMLKRNLIYTAITRAKEKVVMYGTTKALAIAVRTPDAVMRFTGLADKLKHQTALG